MSEQELLEKIRQSAESIEVPESLLPEKILERCRMTEQESAEKSGQQISEPEKVGEETQKALEENGQKTARQNSVEGPKRGKERKKFRISRPGLTAGLSAAAVFIICCISLSRTGWIEFGAEGMSRGQVSMDTAMETESAAAVTEDGVEEITNEAAVLEADAGAGMDTESAAGAENGRIERKNAGDLYTLAESYDAVYERLEEIEKNRDELSRGGIFADGADIAEAEMAPMEDAAMAGGAEELKQSAKADSASSEKYSETNVQTYGIDESDMVKTDGKYLYLLRGSSVSIVSADGEEMRQVCDLEADAESGAADICAMYVDGDMLILMAQESRSTLAEEEIGDEVYYSMKYIDTDVVTSVLTYDISDRKNPVLAGKMTQDGSYVTSRKDGSMLYLFTSKYLLEDYGKEPAEAIPEVNARKIAADCIYLGDRGERALVISSLSVNRPEAVRDSVMILDSGSEIYMGEDSLYLYRRNYQGGGEATEIAKFSLTGGYLNGAAATSVRGSVRDTFAINEKDNKLRVLTTDTTESEWENCLFLLDENLKVTGKLNHIAVGEMIYAARYLGDTAYFITYRNTDPLFAADLSDEKNPKLIGELEITGFSEYLHFWGEDKLLGIGYETDPETGAQKGLKLVMFDMSDPAELKILGTKVLSEASYSPALYDYKAVLADPEENLIGFEAESYQKGVKRTYELFQWNGKSFENLLSGKLDDGYEGENYRGIYIGNRFYIAHPEVIRSYDRTDYELKQKLELE